MWSVCARACVCAGVGVGVGVGAPTNAIYTVGRGFVLHMRGVRSFRQWCVFVCLEARINRLGNRMHCFAHAVICFLASDMPMLYEERSITIPFH